MSSLSLVGVPQMQFGHPPIHSPLLAQETSGSRETFAQNTSCVSVVPIPVLKGLAYHHSCLSDLLYCNVFYLGLSLETVQKLQLVQNATADTILGASWFASVTLLSELGWLPISFLGAI